MKQHYLKQIFAYLLFSFFAFSINAQQAIFNKVEQQSQEFSRANTIKAFSPVLGNELPKPISSKILKEKQVLKLNEQTIQNLKSKTEANIKLAFTINNEPILLKLFEANIFSDDFAAATSTLSARNTATIDRGLHYWGVVDGKENSLASISFFNNEVSGFIAFDGDTYILGKIKDQDYHVLYKNTDLNFTNNFSCDVRLPQNGVEKQIAEQVNQKKAASTFYCVDIHIEGDYDLYLDFGSSLSATTNYINALMAQCIIQFANDNIDIQVSYINVWTSTSPYDAASADVGVMLDELRNYGWGRTNGDLVHLLTTIGGGGVAYLDVLCGNVYNVGVSNVFTTFNNVPVYSWSVNVVTHELGHNLASPHTHDCAWNGNNTAIDDCGYNYSGGTDGCDGPTPAAGTIMSYCHLYGAIGVDFTLGFGPQPKSLIVNTINNQFCLSNCAEPTCTDGILNGNEQGIDCGGDCLPCPDELCDDLNFNDYTLLSYADQDNGTATLSSGGTEIYITGNSWKAIAYPLTITAATVISFDFKSTAQGEIHEISFDSDLTLDREQAIVVYGNQGYTGTVTTPTYNGSGNWQTFTIDLGSQITGSYNYLILTCDDDANATGNSYFRNIKIWEDYNRDLECNTANACADINLDIFFDGFPNQTSWDIEDSSNGNVVLDSNGNYSTQSANTSINSQVGCLADGCYTFNMYDALSNGMCPFQSSAVGSSTFITPGTLITPGSVVGSLSLVSTPGLCGSYQLTNAAGETLASGGGSFGAVQSTSFCLSGGMMQRNTPKNINNNTSKKETLLFELEPNISSNFINVLLDVTLKDATITIFDLNGKQISSLENTNNLEILKLNIAPYKSGTYFLQVKNNENSFVKTFIKY